MGGPVAHEPIDLGDKPIRRSFGRGSALDPSMDPNKPLNIQGWGVNLFAVEQVTRMLALGDVTSDRKFFQAGMVGWVPLSELPAMLEAAAKITGTAPPARTAPVPMPAPRGDPSATSFRRVSSIKLAKARAELPPIEKPK